ncbi:cAMP-binding protein [Marinobacterium lacunae]|uniref:cAMP-binding protein n=1 Tax=Marinobacterium lacunae TaxID=1232683 RepID=A0A081FUZ1_9GAMM|nr:Crp/Fnr family transcriptional regulator [Marinobacterium lacunae]KEA62346.1 cAMP-binding protein [Marinobacterium lacunae]MBR9882631.1 Crp/Fnr family transcriptional regulator [Oceanospirillales bacterium]
MDINQEVERLKQIPMFSKVETSKLKLLAFTSQLLNCRKDEILIKANDPSDCVYLIMDGELEILSRTDCGRESSIIRKRGDLIGEIAVLSKTRRTASVRAVCDTTVMKIDDGAFLDLVTSNPTVALDVMRQLSDKLAEAVNSNESLRARLHALEECGEGSE